MRPSDSTVVFAQGMTTTMREIRCSIELRADDDRLSPGRISGSLMVYGDKARTRRELFADGALTWPDDGIVLNEQHNRQAPILRFVPTVEAERSASTRPCRIPSVGAIAL